MADPKDVGNSQDEPIKDDATPQDDAKKDTPTDTPIPDQWEGKTQEELIGILKDKEKHIGKQAQELGNLRTDMDNLQDDIAFNKQFGGQGQQPPQAQQNPYQPAQQDNTQNLTQIEGDDPDDYVQRKDISGQVTNVVQDILTKTQRMQQDITQKINYHELVLERAKKEAPHVFKGVSNDEVKAQLFNSLSANQLNEGFLVNTNLYKNIARNIQDTKTDYGKNIQTVNQPAKPVATETPASDKPLTPEEGETIPMDDLTKEMLKHRPEGMSEADFLKKVAKRRETFGESRSD